MIYRTYVQDNPLKWRRLCDVTPICYRYILQPVEPAFAKGTKLGSYHRKTEMQVKQTVKLWENFKCRKNGQDIWLKNLH